MPHSGKHGLVPTFWDVLMPWNLKSTYFSLKIIHFLSLNILYVIYVVFWIKYWNLKLPHHCILFLFTICTVSQLFWNRVCIYIQCVCVCLCLCVCVCVCVCVYIYIFFYIYIHFISPCLWNWTADIGLASAMLYQLRICTHNHFYCIKHLMFCAS